MKKILTLIVLMGLFIVAPTAFAATITVNSGGDQQVLTGIKDGNCTLREAVDNANLDLDNSGGDCVAGSGADTIVFSGPMTISLATVITVTSPIEINAESGSGGTTCGANGVVDTVIGVRIENYGLRLEVGSAGSLIRGLNISNLTYTDAISIQNTNDIIIECNFLGTTQSGMATQGFNQSGRGIFLQNASAVTIGGDTFGEGNLISGFVSSNTVNEFPTAVGFDNADDVVIQGNFVGTDKLGTSPLGNNSGVDIRGGSGITIGGNRLLNPAVRNIFAGNILNQANGAAVKINNTDDIVVSGNYFGLGADGVTAMTNGGLGNTGGLDICNASDCGGNDTATEGVQIGGSTLGEGNIFAAETLSEPVEVTNFSLTFSGLLSGVSVQGNWFGLDAAGSVNTDISFDNFRAGALGDVIIGGTSDAANIFGQLNPDVDFGALLVFVEDTNTTIEGNYFGFESDKQTVIGKTMVRAIQIIHNGTVLVQNNTISNVNTGIAILLFDGTLTGHTTLLSNDISDADTGILVGTTNFFGDLQSTEFAPVTILQNRIYNTTTVIDLAQDNNGTLDPEVNLGPTPNDPDDTDIGPNDYLNTPIIHSVNTSTGEVVYSVDVPAGTYRIEFFAGESVGEARGFLGNYTFVSTGANKQQTSILDLSGVDYYHISATTTIDLGNDEYGATSELSQEYVPLAQPKKRSVSGSVSPTYLAQQGIVLDQSSRPTTSSSTTSSSCPADQILTQNLRAGARNGTYHPYTKAIVTEVKILQAHMNRLGFNSGPVDGILGPITDGAIKRMQTFLGTKADGMVGPLTRALINNSCGSEGLKKSL